MLYWAQVNSKTVPYLLTELVNLALGNCVNFGVHDFELRPDLVNDHVRAFGNSLLELLWEVGGDGEAIQQYIQIRTRTSE